MTVRLRGDTQRGETPSLRSTDSGLGYARYGTKQDSIEGALEELNDMLNHYNSLCEMHKEK